MSWHAESAGQQQTQKPYEKMLRIQKECYQSYNFGTATDTSARDIVLHYLYLSFDILHLGLNNACDY